MAIGETFNFNLCNNKSVIIIIKIIIGVLFFFVLLRIINVTKKTVPVIYTGTGPCFVYTAILKF